MCNVGDRVQIKLNNVIYGTIREKLLNGKYLVYWDGAINNPFVYTKEDIIKHYTPDEHFEREIFTL